MTFKFSCQATERKRSTAVQDEPVLIQAGLVMADRQML